MYIENMYNLKYLKRIHIMNCTIALIVNGYLMKYLQIVYPMLHATCYINSHVTLFHGCYLRESKNIYLSKNNVT